MNTSALDDLLGIAEIATVFIGFAVLISVLSPRPSNKHQVLGMVITAAMVLVACVLPLVLRTLQIEAVTIVRVSSVIFAVLNLAVTVAMFRFIPGFSESQGSNLARVVWGIEGSVYSLLVLCAAGIWSVYAITMYYSAVVLLLFQVIVFFISLAIGLSQDESAN